MPSFNKRGSFMQSIKCQSCVPVFNPCVLWTSSLLSVWDPTDPTVVWNSCCKTNDILFSLNTFWIFFENDENVSCRKVLKWFQWPQTGLVCVINVAKYGNDNGEVLVHTKRQVLYVILAMHEHISKPFVCQNVSNKCRVCYPLLWYD